MNMNGVAEETLPSNKEEKFIFFEREKRADFEKSFRNDREYETDQNGNYIGSYDPEKKYVVQMCAFLDEFGLDDNIADISSLTGPEFNRKFDEFKNKMTYLSTRFELRKGRVDLDSKGTVIKIESDYKIEIGKLLNTIRKIVNQEIHDGNKKDKIFSKIANLQSEVDRDQTTIDALFGRAIDLSKAIGECGKNIEPLIDKMGRLKKIFWDNTNQSNHLQQPERPKLIERQENNFDLSDDIPF